MFRLLELSLHGWDLWPAVRIPLDSDIVLVSGRAYTGRDAVHHHLMSHEPPVDLRGGVIYHCGPVVARQGDGWKVTAAGPTTSIPRGCDTPQATAADAELWRSGR